jgi:Subtilase family
MPQRLRSRATAAVAAGLTATCIGVAAAPAFADTVRNQEWWLTSLHVTKAWLSSRGAGVKVAVLDTGVDANQPDLAGSVTTGRDYTGSGRTAGSPFWGVHGTALASIIAGHGHGPHHADGVIGVAPQAKILSVRVTLENKDPLLANSTVAAALPAAIARGIRYAVRHGAQVIDLPLDPAAQAGATTLGGSPAERSAVAAALAKGVVLVAPSGDNGAGSDTVNYPAAYPGVISVGAFGQGFIKAPFTNHQAYATLTAAGNGVIAANGPTGYAKLKSTSAASAVVAGIAALIRSQFPTLTPAQVEQALTSSTAFRHKGGQKDGSGAGTADAAAALLAAATINATPTSSASPGSAGNPTPPTAPVVKVSTKSLWQAVRIPVLGLAALVLLALIILISVRVRQRRVLDAQLAPLQAAARASRAQSAAGMTGMGSPGPGYGPPAGAGVGSRAPASSETSGSGAANFGLGGPGLAGPGLAGQRMTGPDFGRPEQGSPGLAGAGLAGAGSAGAAPLGSGFAGGGRPGSGSIGRPVVSGRPPWEEDDLRAPPASAPAPPAPEPARPSARFLLPGRGLGSSGTAGDRPGQAGPAGRAPGNEGPGNGGPGNGGPAGSVPGSGSPSAGGSVAGREATSSLNLGGWSLGKPGGSTGRAGGRKGVPDAGNGTAGSSTPGSSSPGSSTPGSNTSGSNTSGSSTPGSPAGRGSMGAGPPSPGSPEPWSPGPLSGIGGGTGSNGAAAAARARFGPSPFEDPSFEIPAFGSPTPGGSSFDDGAFGATPGTSTPGTSTPGTSVPGAAGAGSPAPILPAPGSLADAGHPASPAGHGGARGQGRHGASRGASGASSAAAGGAGPDGPVSGRAGEAPALPMRTPGSAPRLNAGRGPRPNGQPPWEPAEKPVSELPWMDAPGSGQSRKVPPRRVFPMGAEGPATGAAADGAGPGGTGTGRPEASRPADPGPPPMTASGLARRRPNSQSPFPDLQGPPPGLDETPGSESGEDEGTSRPMYSWNPSDPTEAFPALPPPGDSHPG